MYFQKCPSIETFGQTSNIQRDAESTNKNKNELYYDCIDDVIFHRIIVMIMAFRYHVSASIMKELLQLLRLFAVLTSNEITLPNRFIKESRYFLDI